MLSLRALAPVALLLAGLGGCRADVIAPSALPGPERAALDTAPSSSPIAAGNKGEAKHDIPPTPVGPLRTQPSVALEEVEGADLARTRTAFAPVPAMVKRCAPLGGAMAVRVTYSEDHTRLAVETPGSLDSNSRVCVLQNLSAVDYDGVLSQKSPSDRPSGFTALVRIDW